MCFSISLVISILSYFLYDDLKHISPASLTSLKDRTITISGFSKTYSITGWRIGYCIVPEQFYEIIGHINDLIYVCGPSPLQFGVANGLDNLTEDFYNNIKESFYPFKIKSVDLNLIYNVNIFK